MCTSTISRVLLLLLLAGPVFAVTPTPTALKVADRNADCTGTLSDTAATFLGQAADRSDFNFWAETGPCFCGYPKGGVTPTPNQTPGNGWSKMNTGFGLTICSMQDLQVACFGSSCNVCWNEGRQVTATPTPTVP